MKAIINIKTDSAVKKDAQKLAEELGLSLSSIVNASLKQFLRNREVYFSAIPKITPKFEKQLHRVENDLKRNKNISPAFDNDADMLSYLHS